MRVSALLLPLMGVVATLVVAKPLPSSAGPFEIRGTWAAEGKTCSDAGLFVEFDGRDILAYKARTDKARVAADYSASYKDGSLTVHLTDVNSREGDQWTFLVQDENAMRMDSSFLSSGGTELMKLTRCNTSPERIASH